MLVMPPLEYDYPYSGTLTVIRAHRGMLERLCPKDLIAAHIGCNYRYAKSNECHVYITKDELLAGTGWTYEIIFRHEVAHCNGWGGDHKGACPADAKTAFEPVKGVHCRGYTCRISEQDDSGLAYNDMTREEYAEAMKEAWQKVKK
jgi:hypothetical protein